MSFIILTRNPSNCAVIGIRADDETDNLAQFDTPGKAEEAADNITMCKAWGYQVVELDEI